MVAGAYDRAPAASPTSWGGVGEDAGTLVVRTPEAFQEKQSIQVHLRHEVAEVDLDRGVTLVDRRESGHQREEPFDEPGSWGPRSWGRRGRRSRIDALAVAAWNAMTVDELLGADLSYASPYSPVWDPVVAAARRAADLLS